MRCKYSPPGPHRPLADNVSRTKLEDEWFAVRAMRHVFHIRPNTTVQGWTTIMQPVLKCSYPLQYVLTLETADGLLPEVQSLSPGEQHVRLRPSAVPPMYGQGGAGGVHP